ncbi:hypothetical protein [Halobacillus sp. B29]|uniref:hypothetical protein n=1 Tax=Halobacillus sp. B29 TaxID=3457432 RepID=UPI003FCCDE8F
MEKWIDYAVLDHVIAMLNDDVIRMVGFKPEHIQFFLVVVLVMSLMWVSRPIIEWMMVKNWNTFASYFTSSLITIAFLQLVDRYAMSQEQSTLPDYYWSICLLAVSSYGVMYVLLKMCKKTWTHLRERAKKQAA